MGRVLEFFCSAVREELSVANERVVDSPAADGRQ